MATTSISITPQFGNNTVTAINCGTSSPRLGGAVDISAFPNLQQFRCISNNITALSGYVQNSNLTLVDFSDNKVTGSIPSLSVLTNMLHFNCAGNLLTGAIPNLNALSGLQAFACSTNSLSGSLPNLNSNTNLHSFQCADQFGAGAGITGSIPNLDNNTALRNFFCHNNKLTGSIPSLSENILLINFFCFTNQLTGSIPNLSTNTELNIFRCGNQTLPNKLTGSIPNLSNNNKLAVFECFINQLTGFAGGSVSNTLGDFQAQINQLNQSSVNAILSAFVVANRTTGTRILNVGGTGNAAPSYTGGVTTTSPGTNFTRSGTTVTANVNSHGHVTGNIVTIDGITPTVFQGTFAVTRITDNQFQYTTISSGAATGAGTATMRRTTNSSDGYASYQNLALVSRPGGPWTITINQP